MTEHNRRPLTPDDFDLAARVLGRAFADDPIMGFLFAGRDTEACSGALFRGYCSAHRGHEGAFVVDDAGVAIWAPPGHWKLGVGTQLRMAPSMIRLFGLTPTSLRHLAAYNRMDAQHATMPPDHWYLAVIGTDPDAQGRGIGAALIDPIIERCDEQGLGAYLESSKETNVPYYRRFGFEVVEECVFNRGPSYWRMWRDPR